VGPSEKERGKGWSGPPGRTGLEEKVGRWKKIGPSGEGKKREGGGLLGWAERRGGGRVWEVLFFLKKIVSNLFQTFETLNSFPNFSRFSKQFKNF
jgi:hypothetical protein